MYKQMTASYTQSRAFLQGHSIQEDIALRGQDRFHVTSESMRTVGRERRV